MKGEFDLLFSLIFDHVRQVRIRRYLHHRWSHSLPLRPILYLLVRPPKLVVTRSRSRTWERLGRVIEVRGSAKPSKTAEKVLAFLDRAEIATRKGSKAGSSSIVAKSA